MDAPVRLLMSDATETAALAAWLGQRVNPGDCILLEGDLGAGKTHFARAAIQARLATHGLAEEVPSPTYTLVQVYDDGVSEIWHCDLYRLSGPEETEELGLIEAMEQAVCFIEWPDRLDDLAPDDALRITMSMTDKPGERELSLFGKHSRWHALLAAAPGITHAL